MQAELVNKLRFYGREPPANNLRIVSAVCASMQTGVRLHSEYGQKALVIAMGQAVTKPSTLEVQLLHESDNKEEQEQPNEEVNDVRDLLQKWQ